MDVMVRCSPGRYAARVVGRLAWMARRPIRAVWRFVDLALKDLYNWGENAVPLWLWLLTLLPLSVQRRLVPWLTNERTK